MENIQVIIGSIDVSRHVRNFIKATQALEVAKSAEEISKLQKLRQTSILGVADALVSILPLDKMSAQIASLALNAIHFIHSVITLPATMTFGALLGVLGGFGGLLIGIVSLFGMKKKKKTISLTWTGEIIIKVQRIDNKIQLIPIVKTGATTVGNLVAQVQQAINKACATVNKILSETIPEDAVDFVWTYLARPYNDMFVIKIDVDATGKVADEDDVRALVREFTTKFNEQLKQVISVIRDVASNACALTFLWAIGAADKVKYMVLNQMPELGYEVEGLWRKELERLTIKLTRTREYDRQISAAIRAAAVQLLADSIYKCLPGTYIGQTLQCNKTYIRNKLFSLADSNPEIRYGMDLIGRNYDFKGRFTKKGWWVEEHRWAEGNIPPGWLFQEASYILKPEVKNGKLLISYRRKSLSFHKKTFFIISQKVEPYDYSAWYGYGGASFGSTEEMQLSIQALATWPPTNDAYDYLLERILAFVNYLLSDVPTEAAKYVANKVSTAEVYLNQYLLLNDAKTTFSVDAWDCQHGLKHRGVQTWSNKPSIFLWLTCTTNSQSYSAQIRYKDEKEKQRKLRDLEQSARPGIYGEIARIDFYILKDVSSLYVPNPDDERYTNLPRALNAMVQDIVDVYFLWLKGYGEEWKKRIRTKVMSEALPRLRMVIKNQILSMASSYASLPPIAVGVGEYEALTAVLNEIDKRAKETTSYLPMLIKNKDDIIKMFGKEEYERLLSELMRRYKSLKIEYDQLMERLANFDITALEGIDLTALTEEQLMGINNMLDKIIQNLTQRSNALDQDISKLKSLLAS